MSNMEKPSEIKNGVGNFEELYESGGQIAEEKYQKMMGEFDELKSNFIQKLDGVKKELDDITDELNKEWKKAREKCQEINNKE